MGTEPTTLSPIVYAIVGTKVVLLVGMLVLLWWWRRRERRRDHTDPRRIAVAVLQAVVTERYVREAWSTAYATQGSPEGVEVRLRTDHQSAVLVRSMPEDQDLASWLATSLNQIMHNQPFSVHVPATHSAAILAEFVSEEDTVVVYDHEHRNPGLPLAQCHDSTAAIHLAAHLKKLLFAVQQRTRQAAPAGDRVVA